MFQYIYIKTDSDIDRAKQVAREAAGKHRGSAFVSSILGSGGRVIETDRYNVVAHALSKAGIHWRRW